MENKELIATFIENYEKTAALIANRKTAPQKKEIMEKISRALSCLIDIINNNCLNELKTFYVYNIILLGELYLKNSAELYTQPYLNTVKDKIEEKLDILRSLSIKREEFHQSR